MGGVVFDLLGSYWPTIRAKKWYWSLFINVLNVLIVKAWQVHCHVEFSKMSHIDFCQQIKSKSHKQNGGRLISDLPKDVRFDRIDHMRQSNTQGRCKVCHENACVMCSESGVYLHSDKTAVFKNVS